MIFHLRLPTVSLTLPFLLPSSSPPIEFKIKSTIPAPSLQILIHPTVELFPHSYAYIHILSFFLTMTDETVEAAPRTHSDWLSDLYLVHNLQMYRNSVSKGLLLSPLSMHFALEEPNITDVSYPLVNALLAYNPGHETIIEEETGKSPANSDIYLLHPQLGGPKAFQERVLETFTNFYEDIVAPYFEESLARGTLKGEIPDENNYRASLIGGVEELRKKEAKVNYQLVGHKGERIKGIFFITEDELLYFPMKDIVLVPDEKQEIRIPFLPTDRKFYYTPLLFYRRFSLPSRLLV